MDYRLCFELLVFSSNMVTLKYCYTTRRIRALEIPWAKTVPVIAMTANAFREDIENGLTPDFNEVMGMLRRYLRK